MALWAGVSETNITPPAGVWMCGYAFRPTGCIAVHDALHARALVLRDDHNCLAILSMDLLGLDFDLVDRVRAGISAGIGIEPTAVMLNASHTHGGPNLRKMNSMGCLDPAYTESLVNKLVHVACQAVERIVPASLAYGRAAVQIGVNRRQVDPATGKSTIGVNLDGPVAPWVDVISVRNSRGAPFAILFSHSCHPTTLGGDNLHITADFCGYACDLVRRELGGSAPMFLQGCAGNINPYPRGTFEDAANHGLTLGRAALEALDRAQPLPAGPLAHSEEAVELPLIPPPTADRCEQALRGWEGRLEEQQQEGDTGRILHAQGMRDFAAYELSIARQGDPPLTKSFRIQCFDAGGVRIVGFPAEMFVQYAMDLDRQASSPVITLGYTNGVHGYIPTAADYSYGGYEVEGSHRYYETLAFAPECEAIIRATSYRLLGFSNVDRSPLAIERERVPFPIRCRKTP